MILVLLGKNSLKKNKEYVYKKNNTARTISEIEAFNGFCYRVLLGERHSKVKGIYDVQGKRVGVASEILPGFISICDYFKLNGKLGKDKLLSSEFIKVLVVSYTEEETDLHTGNYGFDITGFCVKIDDDRSTWSLTSKYANIDPELGNHVHTTPPILSFIVTQRDISCFPKLKDAEPRHWFDRFGSKSYFDVSSLDILMKDGKFIEDKFYMFLKRILIPNEVYQSIGLATISSNKTREKFVKHKCNKTEELKSILLNNTHFQDYIISHPTAIEEIKSEFTAYNKDYKKEKDAYLRVDLVKIEQNFNKITKEIAENYLEREKKMEKLIYYPKAFFSFGVSSFYKGYKDSDNNISASSLPIFFAVIELLGKNGGSLAYEILNLLLKNNNTTHKDQDKIVASLNKM